MSASTVEIDEFKDFIVELMDSNPSPSLEEVLVAVSSTVYSSTASFDFELGRFGLISRGAHDLRQELSVIAQAQVLNVWHSAEEVAVFAGNSPSHPAVRYLDAVQAVIH